jgi:hypothetical protein
MTYEIAIYSTISELLPGEVLAKIASGAACSPRRGDDGELCYDLAYKTSRARVRHFHAGQADFAGHVRGFLGYVLEAAEGNMDTDLWEIYYHVSKVRQGLGVTFEPEWDAENGPELVAALADAVSGFVLVNDMLTDPWGGLLLGPGNDRGKGVRFVFDSAKERRERSCGRLATLGLTTPDSLPTTVADEEALLRSADDAARRAIVLMAVAMRAEGVAQPKVVKFLKQRGASEAVSPEEKAFLMQPQPDEAQMRHLTWRYESLWVLLWALGHVDSLSPPSEQCDARQAIKLINRAPSSQFVGQARLRPAAEILDEVDFYYRAHWHVRRAQLGEVPAIEDLDSDVIEERHYVLNWLTNYQYQDWDKVTTDT